MKAHTKETQNTITPSIALQYLKEGNERFINNLKINRNLLQQVNETKTGQWPFATILSCIDSRTSAELIFDQGLGDIFSIRLAGNVVNNDVIGSMEFACKIAGSRLILILGHTHCGAIKGAYNNLEMGHLTGLLNKILPPIEKVAVMSDQSGHPADEVAILEKISYQNVLHSIREILDQSNLLREMVENGEIDIAGGIYRVESGKVDFFYAANAQHNLKPDSESLVMSV